MFPDFLKAKALLKKQQHKFLSAAIKSNLPAYMKQASYKTIYEGDHLSIRYNEDLKYEKEISKITAESEVGTITDLKSNPNIIYEYILDMAKGLVQKQIEVMIGTFVDVTKLTGNVVNGKGTVTPDSIFEMLEKMEITFDGNGEPNRPSFLVGPAMVEQINKAIAEIDADPILKKRHDQIYERKRNEWNDRQNSRKLVG